MKRKQIPTIGNYQRSLEQGRNNLRPGFTPEHQTDVYERACLPYRAITQPVREFLVRFGVMSEQRREYYPVASALLRARRSYEGKAFELKADEITDIAVLRGLDRSVLDALIRQVIEPAAASSN